MSVRVIKNKIYDGKNTYEVGDIITGLTKKDESRLVLNEVAAYVDKKDLLPDAVADKVEDDTTISEKDEEDSSSDTIDPNSLALNVDDLTKKK